MFWRELAMEISLTSLGSIQIFLFPHFRTDAASLFCNFRETFANRKKEENRVPDKCQLGGQVSLRGSSFTSDMKTISDYTNHHHIFVRSDRKRGKIACFTVQTPSSHSTNVNLLVPNNRLLIVYTTLKTETRQKQHDTQKRQTKD